MADLRAYLAAVATADVATAVQVLDAATDVGEPFVQLLREVVVPAQQYVGDRWFDGSWTVADEHAATAVSEQAVSVLAPRRPVRTEVPLVVMACAEGEAHSFPARLACELAQSDGASVRFLGGSLPAAELRKYLDASHADVLALSCTMPTNLIGAAWGVGVAHDLDIPVVVGGRAFGTEGTKRAAAIGADLLLQEPDLLHAQFEVLRAAPRRPAPDLPAEALHLERPPRELLLFAGERQAAASPWLRRQPPHARDESLRDLGWLARHAAAAVACDDPSIVGGWLEWMLALHTPRGVPAQVILDSADFLADAVEPLAPRAASLLHQQAGEARVRHVP